jgi:2-polyprenyl-3-methyl-5-hydroxy-6-metoxy-1,4-benzoquinol methylase
MATDESEQFWDAQSATFDDEPDHGLRDPDVRRAWSDLLRSVLPEPPADIADLGCGTGSLSVLLSELGYGVTGIDLSARMVERASAKALDAGVAASFRQGDAADPRLEAGSVDVVVVRHVTWALADPGTAIRRWVGLLRPGGRLVLVEGLWSTGTGMTADVLVDFVRPVAPDCTTRPLTDAALWGGPIDDQRYVLVART